MEKEPFVLPERTEDERRDVEQHIAALYDRVRPEAERASFEYGRAMRGVDHDWRQAGASA